MAVRVEKGYNFTKGSCRKSGIRHHLSYKSPFRITRHATPKRAIQPQTDTRDCDHQPAPGPGSRPLPGPSLLGRACSPGEAVTNRDCR